MTTEVESSRPNIRIQIVNNMSEAAVEKMDVDVEPHENEEGEISDGNEESNENVEPVPNKVSWNINAGFTTGINIFDKKVQERLQERAKRFALKPDEIYSFTEQDLQDLRESLGINPSNENEVKFDTVHLLGLEDMSAEDVVDYFASYAPESIEWLDENSCNVVWSDHLSAARALHFKSRVVRGMPAREPKDIFPKEFLDDVEETEQETGQSILVKNKNREIELQNEIGEVILPKKKKYPENSVDISEISIPIPPGYWRLGNPHPKSKCLLVRFGRVTDKLPFKTEKCNKYFKKLSNPAQRNVISETKKRELRSIFERNRELNQAKNPWGSLAKNWDRDAKFREREPIMHNMDKDDDEVQIVEVKNPKLLARLGTKRKLDTNEEEPEGNEENSSKNQKFTSERKKVKAPRMKMYADEEEENLKRKKILLKIKKQTEEIEKRDKGGDLRDMLGPTSRLVTKKDLPVPEQNIDLGTKLKNRSQRMVFAVERDDFHNDYYGEYNSRMIYPDVRNELIERSRLRNSEREKEKLAHNSISRSVLIQSRTRDERHEHSAERERYSGRERHHGHRSSRRRSLERTLHSDRIHSSKSHSRRRRSYSPESKHAGKPRSKVAVVIRAPQKPAVASTIWSKVRKSSETEQSSSGSESESEESENSSSEGSSSSSSSESESESGESAEESDSSSGSSKRRISARNPDRPGFDKSRLSRKVNHKSPLKITTSNEHYAQRKSRK